jgi:uncharacterized membrane protein
VESRAVDRVTAFTDAAIAIALTLLALPLVGVAHDAAGTPLGTILNAHWDDLLAFLISFFVVATYWRTHRRLFDQVGSLDETLLTLNICWLLGVVFLPVPTALLTFESETGVGTAVLYLGNLLLVSSLGLAMAVWIRSHPARQLPGTAAAIRSHVRWSAIICASLAVITALAYPLGSNVFFVLTAMPVARLLALRIRRPQGGQPPV